jgi:predicted nucleotidyltransferase
MAPQSDIIKQVAKFASEIKKSGVHLRRVILYGSYARNQATENSDIDVAMVADEFCGSGFFDIDYFGDTLVKNILIHPKTYSTAYFEEGDPFIEEIKRTGIEIDF